MGGGGGGCLFEAGRLLTFFDFSLGANWRFGAYSIKYGMGKDYAEFAKLKIFRQGTKFLSDKMAEKSRFCELATTKNAISATTKKATNFGLKLFNGTIVN